jgi:hypothetical protein
MEFKRLPFVFWRQPGGEEPVRRWLAELGKEDRAKIGKSLRTVQLGWPVGMPFAATSARASTNCV